MEAKFIVLRLILFMHLHDVYKDLKKELANIDHTWWPVSKKFRPAEFEIVVGAVLTQNTNWRNVEKALDNLIKAKVLTAKQIAEIPTSDLEKLIRPSGFYKQKAKRLKDVAKFIHGYKGNFYKEATRMELLDIKGIGRETADAILLFACGMPFFVVDAYTRCLLARLKMINGKEDYDKIKEMFESALKKDVELYKEFHALIVEHEKRIRSDAKGKTDGRVK